VRRTPLVPRTGDGSLTETADTRQKLDTRLRGYERMCGDRVGYIAFVGPRSNPRTALCFWIS
jgi:hypothetical protein